MPKANNSRSERLETRIEDGKLIISIGVKTLAWATTHSPDHRLCHFDENTGKYYGYAIVDPNEFAADVVREMDREEEDGTTPLHIFFDNAVVAAIEQGSLAVADDLVEINYEEGSELPNEGGGL